MRGQTEEAIRRCAATIREADALLIAAGAGMGVDSGLPDFRGTTGFWRAYPPYARLGLDFVERWKRLDEVVHTLRSLWDPSAESFRGSYYSTEDIQLAPLPAQPGGPPIWIGSWGSDAGLRRVALLADGWLASAYNISPSEFADAWVALRELLFARGRAADVDEPVRVRERQALEEHGTDDAEYRRVRADGQRESRDDDECEGRCAAKTARAVLEVPEPGFHP